MEGEHVIYLDVLFVTELLMNSLVFILYEAISRKKHKKKKALIVILFSSVLGTAGMILACRAVVWNRTMSFALAGVLALLEVVCLQMTETNQPKTERNQQKTERKKRIIRTSILELPTLLAGAFLLAGMLLGIKAADSVWNFAALSRMAVAMTVILVGAVALFQLRNASTAVQKQKTVRITWKEKTYTVTAIIDTGNSLYDKRDGMPIHIVEEEILLKKGQKEQLFKQEPEKFTFVPYSSLGNSHGILTVLSAEQIEILEHGTSIVLKQQKLGLTHQKLSGRNTFQMLLHPDLKACGRK